MKVGIAAGYAIADVNYGGSTGYGRPFRNRLKGRWGIVDVNDCCNAAKHLARQGLVDEKRLCIDGGSAGGYTTLACLAFRSRLDSIRVHCIHVHLCMLSVPCSSGYMIAAMLSSIYSQAGLGR